MTRLEFIQISIIAPIAGLFGIKVTSKRESFGKVFSISAREAAKAMSAVSKAFGNIRIGKNYK